MKPDETDITSTVMTDLFANLTNVFIAVALCSVPAKYTEVKFQLPQVSDAPAAARQVNAETCKIIVDEAGQVRFDGQPLGRVSEAAVRGRIDDMAKERLRRNPKVQFEVATAKDTKAQDLLGLTKLMQPYAKELKFVVISSPSTK